MEDVTQGVNIGDLENIIQQFGGSELQEVIEDILKKQAEGKRKVKI